MTRPSALRAGAVTAAAGLLALTTAAPALAAGSITAPGGGATVEAHQVVDLRAVVEGGSAQAELRLRDPLGISRTVAVAPPRLQDQTLAHAFDTSCPAYPGAPCGDGVPARNGTWVVELAGGAADSRELVVRVPPRPPTGLSGEATGPREVVLTWQRGREPDLTGYVVVDESGAEVSEAPLAACATPTCRHVVTYAEDGPGTAVLAVRARRARCPDCTTPLTGAASEPVRVERPAGLPVPGEEQPSPGASPSPSASRGATPSATPTRQPMALPTGGTGTADAGDLVLGSGGRSLSGTAQLPPLVGGTVDEPVVAPLDDTTFLPELPFGEQPEVLLPQAAPVPPVQAAGPRGPVDLLDDALAARALASSLVLLLAGAHALRWLRSAG